MISIQSIADLELLREAVQLECKQARGRDGQGALPEDFWPTYSAFANTEGGVVVLGLRESQGKFVLEGIVNSAKVRKELFDNLNNRTKVSCNLLSDADVVETTINGRVLLVVDVPRAARKQRPVYLTTNPMAGHTYRRLNEGDCKVADEDVRRMLAEQVEDTRDNGIVAGLELSELCMDTFRAYRQIFSNRQPAHLWNQLPDLEFLGQIGGWRRDRASGLSGVTLGGLLMFGWMREIREELPYFSLDYQERPSAKTEHAWIDRLTLDGTWSGNLFDFYLRVYRRLVADIKVPFQVVDGERQEENAIHLAVREALANTLIHADYSGRSSVLVVKRPDLFGFRNPGLMRVQHDIAIRGGITDCRNRTLQLMFRMVGISEQAGSGIPRIYHGWKAALWRPPALSEHREPSEQTVLTLRMQDLLPEGLVRKLRAQFGGAFDELSAEERLMVAAAAAENVIAHARVCELTGLAAAEASRLLQRLVRGGLLDLHNAGRGAVYALHGATLLTPEDVFGVQSGVSSASSEHLTPSSEHLTPSSEHLAPSSEHLTPSSEHLTPSSEHLVSEFHGPSSEILRDADGRVLSDRLDAPVIDALEHLRPAYRAQLEALAAAPRSKGRLANEPMRQAILAVCVGHYLTLSTLAALVDRAPDALRQQHLKPLQDEGKLRLAFPSKPNDPQQAYRAVDADE
jgi:ATP-dependent DNA helicase RecG